MSIHLINYNTYYTPQIETFLQNLLLNVVKIDDKLFKIPYPGEEVIEEIKEKFPCIYVMRSSSGNGIDPIQGLSLCSSKTYV